jgi:hypothetical protein
MSKDEFNTALTTACDGLAKGTREELEAAIMALPPGKDSETPFYTLAFHLFSQSPDSAMAFLSERMRDGSFPSEWIFSAVDSGIGLIAQKDAALAIQQSSQATEIFPTALGRAKLIATSAASASEREIGEVVRSVSLIKDEELLNKVLEQGRFWKALAEHDGVGDLLASVGEGKVLMNTLSKEVIGASLGASSDFDSGWKIVRERLNGDPQVVSSFFKSWFERDPNSAVSELAQLRQAEEEKVISQNIVTLAKWDKASAVEWANSIQDPVLRDQTLKKLK